MTNARLSNSISALVLEIHQRRSRSLRDGRRDKGSALGYFNLRCGTFNVKINDEVNPQPVSFNHEKMTVENLTRAK